MQRGNWWNTLLDLGIECDLARLGDPHDSAIFLQIHGVNNRNDRSCFAETTGALNPVSNTMASDQLRVFNLYFRQELHEGAIKVGQLALDDDFMHSGYSGLFVNSAFGAMPSQVAASLSSACGYPSAFPIYSVAAPGVWVELRPWESFSWQTGVYYGGPGPDTRDNLGFHWDHAAHSGALVFTEADWRYRVDGHDGALRVGASYHGGHFQDYEALRAGRTEAIAHGLASWYFVQELAVTTDVAGRPKLGLFGRAGISPQHDRSVVTAYADGGINWFAPLAVRPDDVAGLAVSWTQYGWAFRHSAAVAASESTIELTYKAQLTPHFALQADSQFLVNPAPNFASGKRETATVLGLRTTISF